MGTSDSSEGLELRSTHFCEENKRSNTPKPIGPADRKTVNYHKTIYTLENHPIVIYIGVVFVKKSDVRYLSSHSLNQELFKRHKTPFPRFFESLDESLKLSSWIIQSYCRQNRYKSF